MTTNVTGADIAIRLLAALMAGGLIGFDRSMRGRIAGLRTTILMCLAAAGAMIEANLMLEVTETDIMDLKPLMGTRSSDDLDMLFCTLNLTFVVGLKGFG